MIVYLPIIHYPDRFILIVNRLVPAIKIDNTEPLVPETHTRIHKHTAVIRTAVKHYGAHFTQQAFILKSGSSAYSAHLTIHSVLYVNQKFQNYICNLFVVSSHLVLTILISYDIIIYCKLNINIILMSGTYDWRE